jgi:hypothetical protein
VDITGWLEMRSLADALTEYAGPCDPTDLATLTGRPDEEIGVFTRLARWLGLVSTTATDELILAPLIAHCIKMAAR